jgi:hypothetical protein
MLARLKSVTTTIRAFLARYARLPIVPEDAFAIMSRTSKTVPYATGHSYIVAHKGQQFPLRGEVASN